MLWCTMSDNNKTLNTSPTPQASALEKDAARYKWLRNEAVRDYVEFNDRWYESAEDLDQAIDASIASSSGEKQA